MEENIKPLNSWKFALRGGGMIALVMMVVSAVPYFIGNPMTGWTRWLAFIMFIIGIAWSQFYYRNNELGGFIKYNKSLGLGMQITLVCAVILGVFAIVMVLTFPEVMQEAMKEQKRTMLEQGYTEEQVKLGMHYAAMFTTPVAIFFFSIVMYGILGLIVSSITSVIIKKENPELHFPE